MAVVKADVSVVVWVDKSEIALVKSFLAVSNAVVVAKPLVAFSIAVLISAAVSAGFAVM